MQNTLPPWRQVAFTVRDGVGHVKVSGLVNAGKLRGG